MQNNRTDKQAQEQVLEISALERKQSRSREIELERAQEELEKRLEELKDVEMANAQAQGELVHMRKVVDDLNFRLKEAIEISMNYRARANKMENASFAAAEDWKVELEAMENQYHADISRLQKANKELTLEYLAANKARDEAVLARDVATEQAESLSTELEKTRVALAMLSQEKTNLAQAFDELAKQKADLTEAYAACHTAAQAGVVMVVEKEAELRKQTAALFQAKQQAELLRWELFESRKNEMKLCEMENELVLLKQQLAHTNKLNDQQAKVVMDMNAKLQEAYSEIQQAKTEEIKASTLLTSVQIEAEQNRQRWDAEVSTLTEKLKASINKCKTQQIQMMELQEREKCACAQAADSEVKLLKASEDLARAIAKEQSKDEGLKHLTCLLADAELESQILRQQIYEAIFEGEIKAQKALFKMEMEVAEEIVLLQKVLKAAECITSEARVDLQKKSNKLHMVKEQAGVGFSGDHKINEQASVGFRVAKSGSFETIKVEGLPQDGHQLRQALAACQPAVLRIASDVEVAREQIGTALAEVEMLKEAAFVAINEANHAKQEGEQAQMAMSAARKEILTEWEQARLARDQALVENARLEQQILVEQEHVRLARDEAFAVNVKLEQLQQKLSLAPESAFNASEKLQGKSREMSEAWEMVESGAEALVTVKQEEYDALKLEVDEAKESKSLIKTEMLSLTCLNQRLSAQLDAADMEIKALRISSQKTCQQLEEAEKGNMMLEAEVQRLKAEQLSKSWDTRHGAFGLDANAHQSHLDILQNPQLTSLERNLQHNTLAHSIYRECPSSQTEEEEESSEFLPPSKKKKKKALFVRIGTFITKKMN